MQINVCFGHIRLRQVEEPAMRSESDFTTASNVDIATRATRARVSCLPMIVFVLFIFSRVWTHHCNTIRCDTILCI